MKFIKTISVILVLMTLLSYPVFGLLGNADQMNENDNTAGFGYHGIDAANTYLGTQKLVENVGSAMLYEINSDTLMYAWNADERVFPSSLVKIMTALLAVEKGEMDAIVTVTQDALDSVPYYAASAELKADEQMPLSDLLYCMMVGSANDAAAVVAEHISGSQQAFVEEMNNYAERLGCVDTHFVNPHGLHDENQYTTARDLIKIISAAVEQEAFMTYFSTINYVVPATNKSEIRELSSSNFLMNTDKLQLYYDERVKGGRTGIADDDTRCLATVAAENDMLIACVVLGSESTLAEDGKTQAYGSFQETTSLLDLCFDNNRVVQVIYEGQILQQRNVINGENDVILASSDSVHSVLPANLSPDSLVYKYIDATPQLEAPILAGQVMSKVEIWHNGFCVAQADMVAQNDVSYVEMNTQNDTASEGEEFKMSPFVIIICVVAGVAILILSVRGIRYLRMVNAKKEKERHDRRRKQ